MEDTGNQTWFNRKKHDGYDWVRDAHKNYANAHSKAAIHESVYGHYRNIRGKVITLKEILEKRKDTIIEKSYLDKVLLCETNGIKTYYAFNDIRERLSGGGYNARIHIHPYHVYHTLNGKVIQFPIKFYEYEKDMTVTGYINYYIACIINWYYKSDNKLRKLITKFSDDKTRLT